MTKKQKKKPQMTKVLAIVIMGSIFLITIAVIAYAMWAMIYLQNLDALPVLITAVIGSSISEVMAFAVYCAKSYLETKAEEDVRLERDKMLRGGIG